MRSIVIGCVVGVCVAAGLVRAADPVISNLTVEQRVGTKLADIRYDVSDGDGDKVNVSVQVSTNAGLTYDLIVSALQGDVGMQLDAGTNKHIVWDMSVDWDGKFSTNLVARLRVDDGATAVAPAGMVFIPGGTFRMGDTFGEGAADELPVHVVAVSSFFMDRYEVSCALWTNVYNWAVANGYSFENAGYRKGTNYPINTVNWFDCVKWCNARSEKEGLQPCYYTSSATTTVYRTGSLSLLPNCVKWDAGGYRLPTEAEWERAARGGADGHRFPWSDSDTIQHARANYVSDASYAYDTSPTRGYHPVFNDGSNYKLSPVGSFAPNAYGVHDLAGNVTEFCWDLYNSAYYATSPSSDPRGPASGSLRLSRGSDYLRVANWGRCSARFSNIMSGPGANLGFRCVR